jgi:hypothetical protein
MQPSSFLNTVHSEADACVGCVRGSLGTGGFAITGGFGCVPGAGGRGSGRVGCVVVPGRGGFVRTGGRAGGSLGGDVAGVVPGRGGFATTGGRAGGSLGGAWVGGDAGSHEGGGCDGGGCDDGGGPPATCVGGGLDGALLVPVCT